MKLHWVILICMFAGAGVGLLFQQFLEAPAAVGATVADKFAGPGATLSNFEEGGPIAKYNSNKASQGRKFAEGQTVVELVTNRGSEKEKKYPVGNAAEFDQAIQSIGFGEIVFVKLSDSEKYRPLRLGMEVGCARDVWLEPFRFIAQLFMRLLKMLIVPLVLCSIITGVSGLGGGDFGRMGTKTFLYYILTSLLAATTGLVMVNLIMPGVDAPLGLDTSAQLGTEKENFLYILMRMVPENVFQAFTETKMLQIIFFAIMFGYFITKIAEKERDQIRLTIKAGFEVMMKMAGFALMLVPVGVFCLVVKVVGETGLGVFVPLFKYMLTVSLGLVFHAFVILPLLLKLLGRVQPTRWLKAMSPALMTAFSTSSSSMTLPVTMDAVEKRGGVSNKVTSFVLPLGSTVNMDGTAIYECAGVIFLAQYYASYNPEFTLTIGTQIFVVMMALMASIGAAGIPSAGLVMMFTILSALGLPLEGAMLLLAVDRPLDMCRTVVNIWSDSCGTAIIAKSEGETLFGEGASPG